MKRLVLCLATLMALPACHKEKICRRTLQCKKAIDCPQASTKQIAPYVTVWIHGTTLNPLGKYVHTSPLGLSAMASLDDRYRLKKLAKTIAKTDPIKYPFEHFYSFGWQGKLSFKHRQESAEKLHAALEELVKTYKQKYGHAPYIRLITHSHGGNVALNLANVPHTNKEWYINEAILLACPVQLKTEKLIASPLFGKVYSLYSSLDFFQVVDQYSKPGNFAKRCFPDHEKLMQIRLRVNDHAVGHLWFILEKSLKHLPTIINSIDTWEEEKPHTCNEIRQLNLYIK